MTKGGKRAGAGRPRDPNKKGSFTARLPQYQLVWLRDPERTGDASFMIEWALNKTYGLRRPKTPKGE